jgi:hypothetical protein
MVTLSQKKTEEKISKIDKPLNRIIKEKRRFKAIKSKIKSEML